MMTATRQLEPGKWYDIYTLDLDCWRDAEGNRIDDNPGACCWDWFDDGVYTGPDDAGIWPEMVSATAPPTCDWWSGGDDASSDDHKAVFSRYDERQPMLASYHFRVCERPRCAEVVDATDDTTNGMWTLAEIWAATRDWAHCDKMAEVMQAAIERHEASRG